jgi:hypothetical protein
MTQDRNDEIEKIIIKLKKIIENDIKNKNINIGLKRLVCLKNINFSFYYSYRDDDIENYIRQFSQLIFPNIMKFKPEFSNVVLFDSLSWDYHGLTQQYLRAMMNMNLSILYVVLGKISDKNKQIQQELCNYGKAEIIYIPSDMFDVQELRSLYEKIYDFKPFKIFLHSFDVLDCIIINAIDSSVKLRIDLGDHHCWLGIDFTDYIIGFNDWGLVLCNTMKKVTQSKLMSLPYYPILDGTLEFKGFPAYVDGKVLLFSGGALYKTINEDMTFFKMLHRIVKENENALILFSCRGDDSILKKYINDNYLSDKIILIGYRKDLSKVFDHIDIYINTYPLGGGLMVQYAMDKGVPILSAIANATIENLDFTSLGYTYKTEYGELEKFHREANKLINDEEYRLAIGKLIRKYAPSKEKFNKLFSDIYNNNYGHMINNANKNLEKYKFEEQRQMLQDTSIQHSLLSLSANLFRQFSFKMFFLFPYKIVIRGCTDWLIGKFHVNKSK